MARKPGDWRRFAPANKTVRRDGTVETVRYSKRIAGKICARISAGEPWARMANTEGMPCYAALYDWRAKHPEFAEMLAQARQTAAELRADMAVMAAEAATKEDVQLARLKVSAYQKFAQNPAVGRPGEGWRREVGDADAIDRPRRFIVEVRRWTKVTLPDGRVVLREVFPEGEGEEGQ